MKKRLLLILMFLFGLSLIGCDHTDGDGTGTEPALESQEETKSEETNTETKVGTSEESELETIAEAPNTELSSKPETKSSMVNPMHRVSSSEDFKQIDLILNMLEDKEWVEIESYYTIAGNVAEINFTDKITGSSASVRAAKEEMGDITGVYYVFDEENAKEWLFETASGESITITLKVMIDGSDIHGALATWTYKGINYFLWEEDGRKMSHEVAKLAEEIAAVNVW